jgi:hypothetical protein
MKFIKSLVLVLSVISVNYTFAEAKSSSEKHVEGDGHDHSKKDDHKGHDHENEKDHGDHGEEGHKGHEKEGKHEDHDEHDDKDKHDDHSGHGKENGKKHDDHGSHDDHDDHGGGKAIGKGKAIVEVDKDKGIRLSKEAVKTLKIKLQNVEGSSFKISKKTLVASKNTKGVYRFRAGFFKLLPATISKELKDGYMVSVNGVDFGDQIVVDGVSLLRVADIYSTDKSEYGHSH